MSKLSHDEIIDELAISYGIEPEYTDNWGRIQPDLYRDQEEDPQGHGDHG